MFSQLPLTCMVSQLDLSYNQLCGIDEEGDGTYTSEGIQAIADALRVNGSLTSVCSPELQPITLC